MERNRLTPDSLAGIFASGMICSELGIHCVAHIPAPADISTLAKACVTVTIPEITPLIPITFIVLASIIILTLTFFKPTYTVPGLLITFLGIPVYNLWEKSSKKRKIINN